MDKLDFLKKCEDPKYKQNIIDEFHKLYYYSSAVRGTWKNTYWQGWPIQKCPTDLIVYQELIHKIRPDFIIETGTFHGGSAIFFANMLDIVNNGRVFSIDINNMDGKKLPMHDRIKYINGSSTDKKIWNDICLEIDRDDKEKVVLVILDSDHSKNHVLKELELYSSLVNIGSYIIVEDSNIGGHPVVPENVDNPMDAIKEFLVNNKNFVVDKSCEKFYLTFCPNGFLKRI